MKDVMASPSLRVWITLLALAAVLLLARIELLSGTPARVFNDVANDGPNAVSMDLITQNYYEELLKEDRDHQWRGVSVIRRLTLRLAGEDTLPLIPQERNFAGVVFHEEGFLEHSLKPDNVSPHKGVMVSTNRWGHRGPDTYDKAPEPGTFRIALIGGSNSMGTGVEVEHSFARLLEQKLNETLPQETGFERYEIINFSVPRYHLLERVYVADRIAPEFQPHMILLSVTMQDLRRALFEWLATAINQDRDLGFDFVREIVRRSHARSGDSNLKIEQRLQRFKNELAEGCFLQLKRTQEQIDVPIVALALRLEAEQVHRNLVQLSRMAENAGLPVLRIFDAYEGQSASDVYLADDDFHPTVKGHALLSEEIFEKMLQDPIVRSLLYRESGSDSR